MNDAPAKRRLLRRPSTALVIAMASLALVSCGERPLTTLDPESPIARDLDNILIILLLVCAVVFVIVQGGVLYMAKRFGVDTPDDPDAIYADEEFPPQTHGNTRLEIGWTIGPTIIMAIVAFFTLGLLFKLDDVSASEDQQIHEVVVVGQQWWWEFQYHFDDDGVVDLVTAGELVLPVGEEIQLRVTSRDVIHSFWVPKLNGKRDAVPGRINPWTIEAGAVGRFPGECTEFCGLSHAYMEKFAIGLELADWKLWRDNQLLDAEVPAEADADAFAGYKVFSAQCSSCHVINGITTLATSDLPEEERVPDSYAIYDGANRLIDKQTQVSGVAPNLTHIATRSSFAGGIFDLYENVDQLPYPDLAERGDLNRGALEAWIKNAPAQKPNFWDSPSGQRGMTPFLALSAEDIDNLVSFLLTLD